MKIAIPVSKSKTQIYLNQAYIDYVADVKDFEPVLITPRNNLTEAMVRCDGLLLPGGIDIDPIYYGEDNYSSYTVDPEKDAFERELLGMALRMEKPTFGICRGFQLMASEYMLVHESVSKRLELRQHIGGHQQVELQKLERDSASHFVTTKPGLLYWDGGKFDLHAETARQAVNSMHHQCLIVPHGTRQIKGLIPLALTDRGLAPKTDDKVLVCEAFRIIGSASPLMAVQWHPEEMRDYALIENFFKSSDKPLEITTRPENKSAVQS